MPDAGIALDSFAKLFKIYFTFIHAVYSQGNLGGAMWYTMLPFAWLASKASHLMGTMTLPVGCWNS